MKLALCTICTVVAIIFGTGCTTGGGSAAGGGPGVAGAIVTVEYVNPQNFTDFSIQGRNAHSSTSIFSQQVTRTLEPVMRRRFPGDMLTLRFTDIDMAGSRSRGRPGSTRILRPNIPFSLSFDFILQDTSGRTAASGSQRLTDTLHRSLSRNPGHSSPVYFENRMLRRWLQSLSVTH